jgi:tryptophanyl-tRNA synthetase
MARDIAQRFNHIYGDHFVLPEAVVGDDESVLVGLDGRKMSKSYGNTIPLFSTEKKLQKSINKVLTNLLAPGEAKDTDDSAVFQLWQAFASEDQITYMRDQFAAGIGWGQAKKELFSLINEEVKDARERYNELMEDGAKMEQILLAGAVKARKEAKPLMAKIRESVGIGSLAL